MISVEKALSILRKNNLRGPIENAPLTSSVTQVLAADVHAPVSLPPFNQSAMDGYAVSVGASNIYKLVGEVKAGDHQSFNLRKGEAVRIFTGSPVPSSANAVVMQENVRQEGTIIYVDTAILKNENIRPLGEQISKGELALEKGTVLNPAAIGYLASLGIEDVPVYKRPKITIVATGNELISAGKELRYGQIYQSNSIQLLAALNNMGINDVSTVHVKDEYVKTKKVIGNAIKSSDIAIMTGGISVGDYDFVGKSLEDLDIEKLFYKVAQKPGKPLFFGKKENTLIFALPGNPASCLMTFYIYVVPVIKQFLGYHNIRLKRLKRHIADSFTKKEGRAVFLKARLQDGEKVRVLEGQSSAMLHTFALADALVFLPADETFVEKGSPVDTIILPVDVRNS